jgi:hypothetical protein
MDLRGISMFKKLSITISGVCLICFFSTVITVCTKSGDTRNVVAQVGNSVLTQEELKNNFPVEYEHLITHEQYLDFIKRWIDEEVLLQAAVKRKVHLNPEIKTKIKEQRKKIIVEEFLARESKGFSYVPDEEAIQQYYESHQKEFIRRESEIKYAGIVVKSLKQAWQIREMISTGNFMAMIRAHSIGEIPESFADLPYQRMNEIDTCIYSVVFSTRIGGTTQPIRCGDNYHLVRIIDRQGPGTLKPLDEVKQEIANILINGKQKKYLDMKIQELKSDVFFTYNLDLVPGTQKSEVLDTLEDENN